MMCCVSVLKVDKRPFHLFLSLQHRLDLSTDRKTNTIGNFSHATLQCNLFEKRWDEETFRHRCSYFELAWLYPNPFHFLIISLLGFVSKLNSYDSISSLPHCCTSSVQMVIQLFQSLSQTTEEEVASAWGWTSIEKTAERQT